MEEQVVSLEVAKLLREKRFDVPCRYCYGKGVWDSEYSIKDYIEEKRGTVYEGESDTNADWNSTLFTLIMDSMSAPTQTLAQKWLRDTQRTIVLVDYDSTDTKYWCNITYMDSSRCEAFTTSLSCGTYEEALEEGLKQALKLI